MTIPEIQNLVKSYSECDSISRRNEIWEQVEQETRRVFKLLCRYKFRFMEENGLYGTGCDLGESKDCIPTTSPDSFYRHEGGIYAEGTSIETDDDNRWHLNTKVEIPWKYFAYSDEDWKSLQKDSVRKRIDILRKEKENYEHQIEFAKRKIVEISEKISHLEEEVK